MNKKLRFPIYILAVSILLLMIAPKSVKAIGDWINSGSDIYYNSGKVGIGTTTMTTKFQVQDTLNNLNSNNNFTNRIASFGVGDVNGTTTALLFDSNQIEQADKTNGLYLNYNSPAFLSLNYGGGNIGVGTANPKIKFQVQSLGSDGSNINSNNNFSNRIAPFGVGDINGTTPAILIDGNQIEQADPTNGLYLNYNSPGFLSLNNGGGNVGIGTSAPQYKLTVKGDVCLGNC